MNFAELNAIINRLQPARIISPYHSNNPDQIQVNYPDCVLETINRGQTLTLDENELGNLKYRGKFPTSIASLIKMQAGQGGLQMSRVTDLQLEFKDSRFQITGISEPKDDFNVGQPPTLLSQTENQETPAAPL